MEFKVALTVVKGEKPYVVNVAIPDGAGKFIVKEFRFTRIHDATMLAFDYFNSYEKNPGSILKFHNDLLLEREANLELPFGKTD